MSLLQSCSIFDFELEYNDIGQYRMSEVKNCIVLEITGWVAHSSFGVKDIVLNERGDSINVIVNLTLARGEYLGDFKKKIIVDSHINKVTFGPKQVLLWSRKNGVIVPVKPQLKIPRKVNKVYP